jgi:hypothetical protein
MNHLSSFFVSEASYIVICTKCIAVEYSMNE